MTSMNVVRVKAGEEIPPGSPVAANEDGTLRAAGPGDYSVGRTLTPEETRALHLESLELGSDEILISVAWRGRIPT